MFHIKINVIFKNVVQFYLSIILIQILMTLKILFHCLILIISSKFLSNLCFLILNLFINYFNYIMFLNFKFTLILFHIPSSKIHVFQYFFLSLSPLFGGIHMWQWLLVPILQLPLEHWSGHNVNSQFTFTPSTGSDQNVAQKYKKVSIMYQHFISHFWPLLRQTNDKALCR